jgi:cell division septum initiation protein DivIVA
MPTKLRPEIITAAIEGFEAQKTKLDAQIAELRQMLSGGTAAPNATSEPSKRKRRKMSAAGRKAIAEAQRKRWAASKKAARPSAPKAAPKPKRKLSAAGRKAIITATKKRWAVVRAAKAKTGK